MFIMWKFFVDVFRICNKYNTLEMEKFAEVESEKHLHHLDAIDYNSGRLRCPKSKDIAGMGRTCL